MPFAGQTCNDSGKIEPGDIGGRGKMLKVLFVDNDATIGIIANNALEDQRRPAFETKPGIRSACSHQNHLFRVLLLEECSKILDKKN